MPDTYLKTYTLTVAGRRTSIRLEPEFKETLEDIARTSGRSVNALLEEAEAGRAPGQSFTSSVRVFIVTELRKGMR